jgi:hypothetical protein
VPKIEVFKSGTIVVGFVKEVQFFDSRGIFQERISVGGELRQIEKYYDLGGRELLIVVDDTSVVICDLTTFTFLPDFKLVLTGPRACGIKRRRAVLASTSGRNYNVSPFIVPSTIGVAA